LAQKTYPWGDELMPGGRQASAGIYRLTPTGSFSWLVPSFSTGKYGADDPLAFIQAAHGNFYGTLPSGGSANAGSIYEVTPSGQMTTLYQFPHARSGAEQIARCHAMIAWGEFEMKITVLLTFVTLAAALPVFAQSHAGATESKPVAAAPADPLSAGAKAMFDRAKDNILKSAQMVPEKDYAFKPVDTVRNFGQIVGHVADAQYLFCSVALGEKNPAPNIEKTKTTKVDLVAALNDAFAYCDKAYSGMTDAHAADMVKFFGRDMAKLTVLSFNVAHNMEHYGNLVTYMRIKGMVPPSSGGK
jgi:uncharacterized repeat protein (TIGR03803 family)